MDTNIKINCETNGFEEATEQIETLADAYDGFPAQVVIKNCRDCTINVYPSQTKFIETKGEDEKEVRRKTGRWIDFSTMSWTGWHCSKCDYETRRNSPYCPNCGAKMEGGK